MQPAKPTCAVFVDEVAVFVVLVAGVFVLAQAVERPCRMPETPARGMATGLGAGFQIRRPVALAGPCWAAASEGAPESGYLSVFTEKTSIN